MNIERSAGILLHITSLPGPYGIGDLGPEAYKVVDWMKDAGQRWWQILPLGPANDLNYPHSARSSWAGNPLFVSLDMLLKAGDLSKGDLKGLALPRCRRINYGTVKRLRKKLLPKAATTFFDRNKSREQDKYNKFCKEERDWLNDWALFAALRKHFGNKSWNAWPKELVTRDKQALKSAKKELRNEIRIENYIQYRFYEQWLKLRSYAKNYGIKIFGDLPIYCAYDSADVWANPGLFLLKKDGSAKKVAGVPPDAFSDDGQFWGNPIYDWKAHQKENYHWWISRFKGVLKLADVVRIDHFRAIANYWEIPGGDRTARNGRWVKGPGDPFLEAITNALGDAPIIAEDIGGDMQIAYELRDRWNLPGLKVMHWAFGSGGRNWTLPPYHPTNCVVYSATHDNDTSLGWYRKASARERRFFHAYSGCTGKRIHYYMIRLVYSSPSNLAIIPIQDVLGLGSEARINRPGNPRGNFTWKLKAGQLKGKYSDMLQELVSIFGR